MGRPAYTGVNQQGGMDMEGHSLGPEAAARLEQLARSGDARRLREMLREESAQVDQAAREAARGDPKQLMDIVGRLAHSQEGAELLRRIRQQVEQAGLD